MPLATPNGTIKVIAYVEILKEGQVLLVEYRTPPNPEKPGWWIPAPELEYGEHPEDCALRVLKEFGLEGLELALRDVESFVMPGGWHLIFHYKAESARDIATSDAIVKHGWFGVQDLPEASTFAHGNWEREVALEVLGG